jgi:hypothetical protein
MREWMRSKWGAPRRPEPPLWAFPDESVRLAARLCVAGVLIAAGAILVSRLLDADPSRIVGGVRADQGVSTVATSDEKRPHLAAMPASPRPRKQRRGDASPPPSGDAAGSPDVTVAVAETSDQSASSGSTDPGTSVGHPGGGQSAVQPVSSGPGGAGGGTGTGGVVSVSGGSAGRGGPGGAGGSGGAGPGGGGGPG